jgi:hypothetical protein
MASDAKAGRALPSMSPGVESCYGDMELCGEFVNGEKPVETGHEPIIRCDPVIRMPSTPATTSCIAVAGSPCHQSVSSPVRNPPTARRALPVLTEDMPDGSSRRHFGRSGDMSDSVLERYATNALCERQ